MFNTSAFLPSWKARVELKYGQQEIYHEQERGISAESDNLILITHLES